MLDSQHREWRAHGTANQPTLVDAPAAVVQTPGKNSVPMTLFPEKQ
jgi:hypothetical protein